MTFQRLPSGQYFIVASSGKTDKPGAVVDFLLAMMLVVAVQNIGV